MHVNRWHIHHRCSISINWENNEYTDCQKLICMGTDSQTFLRFLQILTNSNIILHHFLYDAKTVVDMVFTRVFLISSYFSRFNFSILVDLRNKFQLFRSIRMWISSFIFIYSCAILTHVWRKWLSICLFA